MPHSQGPAIQRFRESCPFGKSSGRLCYLCQGCELPPALEQAGWFEDDTFNEELAIQHEPSLKRVLEVAARVEDSYALIPPERMDKAGKKAVDYRPAGS